MPRVCYQCGQRTYLGHGVCQNRACTRYSPPREVPAQCAPLNTLLIDRPGFIDPLTWELVGLVITLWRSPFYLPPDVLCDLMFAVVCAETHLYECTIHGLGAAHLVDARRFFRHNAHIMDLRQWDLVDAPENRDERRLTGLDLTCRARIINSPDAEAILYELIDLVDVVNPPPAIGVMCQGGRHRAPSFAVFLHDLVMHGAHIYFHNNSVRRLALGHGQN